ncbi:hypothetical protein G5I_04672 [Acromyrmex echinatior]|uniref:Uncharacterized protein n=1 Tax=Acromyrmex echinatior TaxID=103372 RepID=F4WG98_ACREC|nr:hypothetical protein G5I_04672 [Acromyrmex echinatior]
MLKFVEHTPSRSRVVRPAGIVALLRSAHQSIGRPIGRFVTQIDLDGRTDLNTCRLKIKNKSARKVHQQP